MILLETCINGYKFAIFQEKEIQTNEFKILIYETNTMQYKPVFEFNINENIPLRQLVTAISEYANSKTYRELIHKIEKGTKKGLEELKGNE